MKRRFALMGLATAALALAAGSAQFWPRATPKLNDADFAARYIQPLAPPDAALRVYHLGHSLKGADIPAFIAQLAEAAGKPGHSYNSQLGWGASLKNHWDGRAAIAGFDTMNTAPAWADPREALGSGQYDALVLTEMVELKDAIRWHESSVHLARWAALARAARPDLRMYLYESWHDLTTPDGWLERLDTDPAMLWEGTILAEAMAQPDTGTIHVIPAGRIMAHLVRMVEGMGGVPGMTDRTDLFGRNPDGSLDTIHINDLGAYLVALAHVAVLYHIDPRGLPHRLTRADGTQATPPSPELARLMQDSVWHVTRSLPVTGLPLVTE
ncbi:MAG: hypothetical protein ACK4HW_00970 [Roseinatronobacter sp.]